MKKHFFALKVEHFVLGWITMQELHDQAQFLFFCFFVRLLNFKLKFDLSQLAFKMVRTRSIPYVTFRQSNQILMFCIHTY